MDLALNNLPRLICIKTQPTNQLFCFFRKNVCNFTEMNNFESKSSASLKFYTVNHLEFNCIHYPQEAFIVDLKNILYEFRRKL